MTSAARLHLHGMGNDEMPRKIMETKLEGNRIMRGPKLRWSDGAVEDLRKLGIHGWWMVTRDRLSWKNVLQVIVGCSAADDDRFKVNVCW
jgi:hypothetical protein